MPVEIKELHIRVVVNATSGQQSSSVASQRPATTGGGDEKELLVSECVEQVLRILENKRER